MFAEVARHMADLVLDFDGNRARCRCLGIEGEALRVSSREQLECEKCRNKSTRRAAGSSQSERAEAARQERVMASEDSDVGQHVLCSTLLLCSGPLRALHQLSHGPPMTFGRAGPRKRRRISVVCRFAPSISGLTPRFLVSGGRDHGACDARGHMQQPPSAHAQTAFPELHLPSSARPVSW